jgi:membrane-bound metal-dependent hydrolase YbcI (DUF457 family)
LNLVKGITHFTIGVALASLFPEAVRQGAGGNPLYFLLGGAFGLLPDTLDFRFGRFLHRHDVEIVPDPNARDPRMIADGVAEAMNRAFETGHARTVKLNTVQLGAGVWQRYELRFNVPSRCVEVRYGPRVDTGGAVVAEGPLAGPEAEASAPLLCGIKLDHQEKTTIDAFDGPAFRMEPAADGRIRPVFLPWHRAFSHSLPLALALAVPGFLLWGRLAALVILAAYAAHVLVDQLGFMGGDLFYPFGSGRRREGLKLARPTEAFPNFALIWLSCLLVFRNLYGSLPWKPAALNPLKLAFYGAVIPWAVYVAARRFLARGGS